MMGSARSLSALIQQNNADLGAHRKGDQFVHQVMVQNWTRPISSKPSFR